MMARESVAERPEDIVDELKPGTKLLRGQYTIEKFLNAGGFGITYLAKNSLDRDVVIKECFPGSFCRRTATMVNARSRAHENEFAQIVKAFVQEAKSLSKLIHPNIVGVHQVFEDNNTAYMAIDYVDGRDLLHIIENGSEKLAPQQVMAMLRKLLGAVAFIHDNAVLHRDISPDNVLIDKSGEPILIDFGAARQQATVIGGKAMSALRVVKDGYSPQEFYVSGSVQNPSSDLYALAATFHHVIVGDPPPNSQSRLVAIAENGEDPYEPLAGRIQGYPEEFLRAIDEAVNVLPKDRIQSAREWLDRIGSKPKLRVIPNEQDDGGAREPEADQEDVSVEKSLDPIETPTLETPSAENSKAPPPSNRGRSEGSGKAPVYAFVGIAVLLFAAGVFFLSSSSDDGSEPRQIRLPAEAQETRAADNTSVGSASREAPAMVTREATEPRSPLQLDAQNDIAVSPGAAEAATVTERFPEQTVSARQVDDASWTVQLPFETQTGAENGAFPEIVGVLADRQAGATNAWISEGVTIYAVNGEFVSDQREIENVLNALITPNDDPFLYVPMRVKTSKDAPFQEVTLSAPTALEVTLANGVAVRVAYGDDAWQTVVTEVANSEEGGLTVGDILLSESETGETMDSAHSLERSLVKLAQAQEPSAVFEVSREGETLRATMTLAKNG